MSQVRSAVERLEASIQYPNNRQVIAESIRLTLEEARACDDAVSEAQARVRAMLSAEFRNANSVVPFEISETCNFERWSVTIQYPLGQPLVIDENA